MTSRIAMNMETSDPQLRNARGDIPLSNLAFDTEAESEMQVASNQEIESRALAPTDCGRQAYLVLAGCTVIQAPVWGKQTLFALGFT